MLHQPEVYGVVSGAAHVASGIFFAGVIVALIIVVLVAYLIRRAL